MHPMKSRLLFLITLIVAQFGCSRQQHDLTPAEEKLVPVSAELLMLSEELKSPRPTLDSAAYQKEVQSILSRNGLTKEEFSNRLKALAQSQEVFSQFQAKVHDDLERRKVKQPK
jgi:hypothetical protein